jgi:hypothetical protein
VTEQATNLVDATPPESSVQYDQPWLTSFLRPALIAILAACLVLALLAFVRRFVTDLPPGYVDLLVVLGVLVSLFGSATTTWLAQPEQRGRRTFGYRASELGLILVITRLSIWLITGAWPTAELFLTRPIDSLLDGYFWLGFFVVAIAWAQSTAMTGDLLAMALQPDDLYMARTFTDRWQDTARPVYTDRPGILRRFVARWVLGGIFLVILAAGSQVDFPQRGFFAVLRQNIEPAVIVAIIVYFLVGLALISQGQLAVLRARWTVQKIPSAESVLRNWPIYALVLIGLLGILAAALPLGGTFWLAVILVNVIYFIYNLLFDIFRFVMGLLLLLMSLLTGDPPPETPPEQPPMEPLAPPEIPPQTNLMPPWAGGVLFWTLTALLLGYAAYIYFSGKGANLAWLRRLWEMLRLRWAQMFSAYQGWRLSQLARVAKESDETEGKGRRGLLSWLNLRNLDPDQQVRYYYLAMLERAEEIGFPRRRSETPLRYAVRLEEQVTTVHTETVNAETANVETAKTETLTAPTLAQPQDAEAIQALTDAFVQVRYANQRTRSEWMPELKRIWRKIEIVLKL